MLELPCRAARLLGAVACAALCLLAFAGEPAPADATSFDPHLEASLSDTSPDAVSDFSFAFSIDAPDANFETVITFIPPGFTIAPDAGVPNGALAGVLNANATLGLLNNACNNPTPVRFDLMDASTDIDDTIPLYSGFQDYDGNGLPENVDRYPQFLTRIAPEIQPLARLYGQALVVGTQTFINFVVFSPGAALPRVPALDPALGYPTMVFLNDQTVPTQPINITDFCTPLSTSTTLFGSSLDNPATNADEAGHDLRRNPPDAGVYHPLSFVRSQWDADNDGIENPLDPCPFAADPGWNPRTANDSLDPDSDGLPPSCDPDNAGTNTDQDGDFYLNRFDNCPLVSNGYPVDSDRDIIGDACDPHPLDPTNGGAAHRHQVCRGSVVEIGSGGPSIPAPDCPSGPDLTIPPNLQVSVAPILRQGTVASVAVFIFDPLTDTPFPAISTHFEVTGANPAFGDCLTSQSGSCAFNYLGANAGTDTIVVTATASGIDLMKERVVEWMAPPANDDLTNATLVPNLPFSVEPNVVAAGEEPGEDLLECTYRPDSVWYRFVPPGDVFLRVEAETESGAVLLSAYHGNAMPSLDDVGCGYPYDPREGANDTYLFAKLTAGETYFIRVTGIGLYEAPNGLVLTFSEGVENDANCDDAFDARDALSMLSIYVGGPYPRCVTAITHCEALAGPTGVLILLRVLADLSADPERPCPS